MIVNIILILDLMLLGVVVLVYFKYSYKERGFLSEQASQSLELQQRIYQIQILNEISERIGYSLDRDKIVEIITSSLGNLLEYDTVSFMVFEEDESLVFKCHVANTVNHKFIEEVKQKMLRSISEMEDKDLTEVKMDESITGNILDDSMNVSVQSFFNVPVVISNELVGIINVSSTEPGNYNKSQASILYSITNQAGTAVTKLQSILQSEKGKLSSIIYSLTDAVVMVGMNNQVVVSNPAVKEFLGILGSKTVTMFDIVDALAGKVDIRTKIEQAIMQHEPVEISEVVMHDKVAEVTITPVRSPQGEQLGAAVVFHDITTEKDLEKVRQDFTAMMVHELRAPLTAVKWTSQTLGKEAKPEDQIPAKKVKDAAKTIESASENMLELVNDLLDVAKIESGKFDLNLQEYDLMAIIGEQVKMFEPQAQIKHLPINILGPEKCMVKCDRVRISQVIENLLSNAIKYSDSGKIDVDLEVDSQKRVVRVAIKDSGVGVSKEDLSQLFSKFKQLKGSDNARKGTGLGLVVTKGIIEAHGGQIWAESPGENMGSTFYFSLPL